eukprot:PLAT15260.1.p1 GENE.PLAT15260.1~~PLAT15260.1.p1  ORF type:complete len:526 (-),score=263.79 PLAT15260.1:134-1711(-)
MERMTTRLVRAASASAAPELASRVEDEAASDDGDSGHRELSPRRSTRSLRADQLAEELNRLYATLDSKERDLQLAARIGEALLAENAELREAKRGSAEALAEVSSELTRCRERAVEAERMNGRLSGRLDRTADALGEAEDDADRLRGELRELRAEVSSLRRARHDALDSVVALDELRSALDDCQSARDKALAELAAKVDELNVCSEQLFTAEEELTVAQEEAEAAAEALADMTDTHVPLHEYEAVVELEADARIALAGREAELAAERERTEEVPLLRSELRSAMEEISRLEELLEEADRKSRVRARKKKKKKKKEQKETKEKGKKRTEEAAEEAGGLEDIALEVSGGEGAAAGAAEEEKKAREEDEEDGEDDEEQEDDEEEEDEAEYALEEVEAGMSLFDEIRPLLLQAAAKHSDAGDGSGRRHGGDDDPMFFHFRMTAVSVKVWLASTDQIAYEPPPLRVDLLYERVLSEKVPFHEWYDWLRATYMRAYLDQLVKSRLEKAPAPAGLHRKPASDDDDAPAAETG